MIRSGDYSCLAITIIVIFYLFILFYFLPLIGVPNESVNTPMASDLGGSHQ